MNNEYYIVPKGSNEPIYLDLSIGLSNMKLLLHIDYQINYYEFYYFLKVFETIEKSSSIENYIFYLTWSNLARLPSYGQNVVAVVLGDEWCRTPKYCHLVKAVFKCYGTSPTLEYNLLRPSYLNLMALFNFMRVYTLGMPGKVNYALQKLKNERVGTVKIAPIYDIPLGYFNQWNLPIKPIQDRLYDVSFAGSIEQKKMHSVWSWNYWLKSPKTIARKKMLSAINVVQTKNPDIKFDLTIHSHFGASVGADINNYCEKLMNTKICLVPRGTSLETYRFFEAIRYGCIVVTEALPSKWFYDDSPAIKVTDWSELVEILDKLLGDRELMKKKHQESLNWWRTKCSEVAVADYIALKLNYTEQI